jgi:hypothetical protein
MNLAAGFSDGQFRIPCVPSGQGAAPGVKRADSQVTGTTSVIFPT